MLKNKLDFGIKSTLILMTLEHRDLFLWFDLSNSYVKLNITINIYVYYDSFFIDGKKKK